MREEPCKAYGHLFPSHEAMRHAVLAVLEDWQIPDCTELEGDILRISFEGVFFPLDDVLVAVRPYLQDASASLDLPDASASRNLQDTSVSPKATESPEQAGLKPEKSIPLPDAPISDSEKVMANLTATSAEQSDQQEHAVHSEPCTQTEHPATSGKIDVFDLENWTVTRAQFTGTQVQCTTRSLNDVLAYSGH